MRKKLAVTAATAPYATPSIPQNCPAKAAIATLPAKIACLQARLAFYNSHENWLSRQFAIEYAVLFDLQLPMLSALSCAFPLGGTSNHFRVDRLKEVGGWDPYNVTEDADLGFRLGSRSSSCRRHCR